MPRGKLAVEWCGVNTPIAVHQSGAGYYIGVVNPRTGEPISRESKEYFRTREEAEYAFNNDLWTQRDHP